MKLAHPEALVADLEEGLGRVDAYCERMPPQYRLRMGVSELATVAIAKALQATGRRVALAETRPKLGVAPNETHVFPLVNPEVKGTPYTIVDANFSGLLRLAGITPETTFMSGDDLYPKEKILTFTPASRDHPAALLEMKASKALQLLDAKEQHPTEQGQLPPFWGMHKYMVFRYFAEFWNPEYYYQYSPDKKMVENATILSYYIGKESVELEDD